MIWLIDKQYRLELNLPDTQRMTKKEFYDFCAANEHLRIERDENEQIYIMAPVGGNSGRKHIQIVLELETWNKVSAKGVTFDSSTGFDLPDKSMRSADAAWVKKERWEKLTEKQKEHFVPFAPDFVIELQSASDNLKPAQAKMNKWIENGTRLAWLIIPKNELVYVYREDGSVSKAEGFDQKLSGENVLEDFEFDLKVLR